MKKESKYITVLDFEISRVFQYKVNELDLDVPWVDEACEDYDYPDVWECIEDELETCNIDVEPQDVYFANGILVHNKGP